LACETCNYCAYRGYVGNPDCCNNPDSPDFDKEVGDHHSCDLFIGHMEMSEYNDYVQNKSDMAETPFTIEQWRQANIDMAEE